MNSGPDGACANVRSPKFNRCLLVLDRAGDRSGALMLLNASPFNGWRGEAAVDRHAHGRVACSAHVKRKADHIANTPRAAKIAVAARVPLFLPEPAHTPRPTVVTSALPVSIFAAREAV